MRDSEESISAMEQQKHLVTSLPRIPSTDMDKVGSSIEDHMTAITNATMRLGNYSISAIK
jgi:hypothetical protein